MTLVHLIHHQAADVGDFVEAGLRDRRHGRIGRVDEAELGVTERRAGDRRGIEVAGGGGGRLGAGGGVSGTEARDQR